MAKDPTCFKLSLHVQKYNRLGTILWTCSCWIYCSLNELSNWHCTYILRKLWRIVKKNSKKKTQSFPLSEQEVPSLLSQHMLPFSFCYCYCTPALTVLPFLLLLFPNARTSRHPPQMPSLHVPFEELQCRKEGDASLVLPVSLWRRKGALSSSESLSFLPSLTGNWSLSSYVLVSV